MACSFVAVLAKVSHAILNKEAECERHDTKWSSGRIVVVDRTGPANGRSQPRVEAKVNKRYLTRLATDGGACKCRRG
jgi:hypothetical protein